MGSYTVGKDIVSYCGKCKLSLSHTIVALKDPQTIAKLKCNTCHSLHAHRSPGASKRKKITVGPKKRGTAKPLSEVWGETIQAATGDPLPYTIRHRFQKGDVINHQKFGLGVVDEFIDNDKMQVIFQHEIKTLIHNK